jgi:hypothetical protein
MVREVKKGGRPQEDNGLWLTILPKETIDVCQLCHQKNLLGDGYCMNCWDKKISSVKSVEREWREKRRQQEIENEK